METNRSEKKLKRGLQDLSPLFQTPVADPSTAATTAAPVSFDVQFLTVCAPDQEGDSFLANAYLASQIVRHTPLYASLVSVAPGFDALPSKQEDPFPALEHLDSRISRIRLSHQELWSLTHRGRVGNRGGLGSGFLRESSSFLVLIEFEPAQLRSLGPVALLLDRVILFIQPEAESLREAYRLMKIFWGLNREIEFFLLFRGRSLPRDSEEFLFERFSLITSRFLGISPVWLGDLALPDNGGASLVPSEPHGGFHLEAVLQAEGLKRPLAPEKARFWQGIQGVLGTRFLEETR